MTDTTQEDVDWLRNLMEYSDNAFEGGCAVPRFDRLRKTITAYQSLGSVKYLAALVEEHEAANDVSTVAPEFTRQWEKDWGGDYFDVSCKFCGKDQEQGGERHETRCVVPPLCAFMRKLETAHDNAERLREEGL
jgi:hypothetical protein